MAYLMLQTFIKLLTRPRIDLSHLREHNLRHNFQDTIIPLCSLLSRNKINHSSFLRCQNLITPKTDLMNGNLIQTFLMMKHP